MRHAVCTTFCLLILLCIPAHGSNQAIQAPSGWTESGPEAHAQRFLDLMVKGKLDDAFKAFLGNQKSDSLDKLKFEIYRTYQKSGKPYGYEKVLEQEAGKSTLRLRYILMFEKVPMMFDIYYYNPGTKWRLRTFTYSTNIKRIFE